MAKSTETFVVDDRVKHRAFGEGTISEVGDRYTTIVFDESGTRKFVNSIVKLDRTDTPAPPKPAARRKRKTTVKATTKVKAKTKTTKTTKATKATKAKTKTKAKAKTKTKTKTK